MATVHIRNDDRARHVAAYQVLDQINTLSNEDLEVAVLWCARRHRPAEKVVQKIYRNLTPDWRSRFREYRGRVHVTNRWAGLTSLTGSPYSGEGLAWIASGAVAAALTPDAAASNEVATLTRMYRDVMTLVEASRTSPQMREMITGLSSDWWGNADDLLAAARRIL